VTSFANKMSVENIDALDGPPPFCFPPLPMSYLYYMGQNEWPQLARLDRNHALLVRLELLRLPPRIGV
jgi:hypothetical protein